MAARIDGPRNQRFDGDIAKDVHGMIRMEMHLVQCVDPKGYRRMVIVGKAGKKLYTFPDGFWENMGVVPQWLEEKLRPMLYPDEAAEESRAKAQAKRGKASKPEQLGSDKVEVM